MIAVFLEHIEISPGVCGGKPHVSGHRITVQSIAVWHERMGMAPEEIAAEYGLTLGDVYAALSYYHDHRAELDEAIRNEDSFAEKLRNQTSSKLAGKMSAIMTADHLEARARRGSRAKYLSALRRVPDVEP
jgi:uncharacterized protein (DUF433 family)